MWKAVEKAEHGEKLPKRTVNVINELLGCLLYFYLQMDYLLAHHCHQWRQTYTWSISKTKLKTWIRYVDDTFIEWNQGNKELEEDSNLPFKKSRYHHFCLQKCTHTGQLHFKSSAVYKE